MRWTRLLEWQNWRASDCARLHICSWNFRKRCARGNCWECIQNLRLSCGTELWKSLQSEATSEYYFVTVFSTTPKYDFFRIFAIFQSSEIKLNSIWQQTLHKLENCKLQTTKLIVSHSQVILRYQFSIAFSHIMIHDTSYKMDIGLNRISRG